MLAQISLAVSSSSAKPDHFIMLFLSCCLGQCSRMSTNGGTSLVQTSPCVLIQAMSEPCKFCSINNSWHEAFLSPPIQLRLSSKLLPLWIMLTFEALVLHVIILNASAKDMALAGPLVLPCLSLHFSPCSLLSVISDERRLSSLSRPSVVHPSSACLRHRLSRITESAPPSPISWWYHPLSTFSYAAPWVSHCPACLGGAACTQLQN